MNDKDLHNLKNIKTPEPSSEAKEKAVNIAVSEFKKVAPSPQPSPLKGEGVTSLIKEKQKNSQGFSDVLRLTNILTDKLWEFIMKKRIIKGAAFACVLVIVGLVSLTFLGGEIEQTFNYVGTSLESSSIPTRGDWEEQKSRPIPRAKVAPPSAPLLLKERTKTTGISKNMPAPGGMVMQDEVAPQPPQYEGRDKFEEIEINPIKQVSEEPVSTFSIDVDTSAYAFIRRQLNNGVLPQKNAVRIEEMINYFDYDYPLPENAETPFKPTVAVYPTPWNDNTKLVHIGIKGHDIIPQEKPKSNLVFLLDVSGSMSSQDKLPLLKNAFKLMVENMDEDDTVSIVTYAGRSATVLEPTKVADKHKIISALESLNSGGSTAGAGGIKRAYELAEANFDKEGVNRVILATDGDFNVGITNREELKGYIERKRDSGIFLSILGFGQGNYNDALMQDLAQNGNGNAAYIDSLNEARKVLVEEASSTLFPIAKDVKIQIEFNPKAVSEYRLIGYENRMLKREDFNNDKVDAGDIGSGHTVTAIYEITPVGSPKMVDDLRYGKKQETVKEPSSEYAYLKLRYKLPKESKSKLITLPITEKLEKSSINQTSDDVRFAASVAGFGQLLRGGKYLNDFTYDDVIELAVNAKGKDEFGYRAEFVNLVRLAKSAKGM